MRVLIHGVNSRNKGADLLLAAASSRLRELGHQAVVNVRDVDATSRSTYDVAGVFSIERLRALRSLGLDFIPRAFASRLPVAGDRSIDYVLDASGYSLTDAWGMPPIRSRLSRLPRWTSRGVGFAMLPQAFGPFTSDELRGGVRDVVAYADMIWARDGTSREMIAGLGVDDSVLRQAPDITIGFNAGPTASDAQGQVLLVPNWNLAKRSGEGGRERYLQSLVDIAMGLRAQGLIVTGLCHEGSRDLEIIEEVARRVGGMAVLDPKTGVACKRIIAGSDLVIAGRYHALVSALSSGVPVVGHSWSHKYQALMEDFAVTDGLADPLDSTETLTRVDALDADAERTRIIARRSEVTKQVDAVWRAVDERVRG